MHALHHLDRCDQRFIGVVVHGDGGPPKRDQPVPRVFVKRSLLTEQWVGEALEEFARELCRILQAAYCCQACVVLHVSRQHGDIAITGHERLVNALAQHLAQNRWRYIVRESAQQAHLVALSQPPLQRNQQEQHDVSQQWGDDAEAELLSHEPSSYH